MKQGILPLVPVGATPVGELHSIGRSDDSVIWFVGSLPVYVHDSKDQDSFRLNVARLHVDCGVKQATLKAALGLHRNSLRAWVNLYRKKGAAGFFAPTRGRGASILTPEVVAQCELLFAAGKSRASVAEELGIPKGALDKGIQQKRVRVPDKVNSALPVPTSTSSERAAASRHEAEDGMGMGCTRVLERTLAAVGKLNGAEVSFEACIGVANGGVLCALPALVANGLFAHLSRLQQPLGGYYLATHVVLLLALMALLRIKSVEALRREAPAEMGVLLGLDRVPEVRCLRLKLAQLCAKAETVEDWAHALTQQWFNDDPDMAGTLYVDGHVRVYHGSKTELPRRYVARQRLCMRGVTDYWVNDRIGKPFFYVSREVDDGLLGVLRDTIVERLLKDVPNQPLNETLLANQLLYRFRIVFDRAGCSPDFILEMWQSHRIAILTYRKNQGDDWPESEFYTQSVTLANGEIIEMELAERDVWITSKRGSMLIREIRRLNRGKHQRHQTAIICSDLIGVTAEIAADMFARWSQENFFRYMLLEFGIDLLACYRTEGFPCATEVPNPARKKLDSEIRSARGKLHAIQAKMGAGTLEEAGMDRAAVRAWSEQKETLLADAKKLEQDIARIGAERKGMATHIPFDKLPEKHQFKRLEPTRKKFMDTIRMISYRAETAMAAVVAPAMKKPDEVRSLLKALFEAPADLLPDTAANVLRVRVHPLAEERMNDALKPLLEQLNDAAFTYPDTTLQLRYELVGAYDGNSP